MAVQELRNEPGRGAEGRTPEFAERSLEIREAAGVGEIEHAQGPNHLQSPTAGLLASCDFVDDEQRSPELDAELNGGQFADMEIEVRREGRAG